MTVMTLDYVLANYRDGDEHGWDVEFEWLWANHPKRMQQLVRSIEAHGILTPILLGNDGRVWDGHHRLCAARHLGIAFVPIEVTR